MTATHTYIYDPRGIVDGSTTDETIVRTPLSLDRGYGRYAVVTTMFDFTASNSWYFVEYYDDHGSAFASYEMIARQAERDAEENEADCIVDGVVIIGL